MKLGSSLNLKRAMAAFGLAYVAITVLGTLLSFAIAAVLHTPATAEPMQNQAYLLSEPFLPGLNLLVWMAASWLYFGDPSNNRPALAQSVALGLFWLAVALPLDFIAFVVVKTPVSLNAGDFYIGQFPWIYLIYLAVLVSPTCYVMLSRRPELRTS